MRPKKVVVISRGNGRNEAEIIVIIKSRENGGNETEEKLWQ